jgi:hypothetical protein
MSRRLDIELTSRTDEGTYTWRAAGAKQPRGTVEASLLPGGVSVGDTVRAELESGLDGLEIIAILARPDKADERPSNRIEVLGTARHGPDVSVSYASGGRRRRADGDGFDRRHDRDHERERERGRGRGEEGGRRPAGRRGEEAGPARGSRPASPGRPERARSAPGRRAGAPPREAGEPQQASARDERARPAPVRRERKPTVSTAHRNALLASLGPQELPIAEQLLRGGIPAVRQALAEHTGTQPNGAAAAVNSDAVLAIAEKLLPRVNLASWKDRASSAQASGKELRLRELRAVVTASRTVTLDDEARATAKALQESLEQRLQALRSEWLARMTKALDEGRVADAVRLSARPPEPSTRVPAEVAVRLADAAGEAMTAESGPQDWLAILEAVVESPVRRNVKPRGIPDAPEAREAAHRAAGSVPELAKLLGIRIPPPPPPRRPAGSGAGPRVMAAGGARPAAGR